MDATQRLTVVASAAISGQTYVLDRVRYSRATCDFLA